MKLRWRFVDLRKRGIRSTLGETHAPLAFEEDVDGRFFALDLATYVVDALQKAHVGLYELEGATAVQLLAFADDAVGCFLGSADDIDSRFRSIFGQCLHRVLPNATRTPYKDGHETVGERLQDAFVRRGDIRKGNHGFDLS